MGRECTMKATKPLKAVSDEMTKPSKFNGFLRVVDNVVGYGVAFGIIGFFAVQAAPIIEKMVTTPGGMLLAGFGACCVGGYKLISRQIRKSGEEGEAVWQDIKNRSGGKKEALRIYGIKGRTPSGPS